MHSDYEVNSINFDDDGVVSITYLNKSEALRREGTLFRSHTVSVAPSGSALYSDAREILNAAKELLATLEEVYRDEAAWLPEETADDEDEDDLGMGF